MIKSVNVTNYLGQSITLELRRPERSGFLIREIRGLGPGKAFINTSDMSTGDGSVYNSARMANRNIVLEIDYLGNPSIEESRQLSYSFFPIKKEVTLRFKTDKRECEIRGYVENNDPNIFSKKEGTQISIICNDPYFYSLVSYLEVFLGVVDTFQFEFSNESLTEDLIEFGEIISTPNKTIFYEGDSEVGFIMSLKALDNLTNLKIYNLDTREIFQLNDDKLAAITGASILPGDEIYISSLRGNKYILLLRDGEYTNILNAIEKESAWFTLRKGVNNFAYTVDQGISNLYLKINYKLLYEGI
jgi:hypothetical protein